MLYSISPKLASIAACSAATATTSDGTSSIPIARVLPLLDAQIDIAHLRARLQQYETALRVGACVAHGRVFQTEQILSRVRSCEERIRTGWSRH